MDQGRIEQVDEPHDVGLPELVCLGLQPLPRFGLSVATWAGMIGYAKTLSLVGSTYIPPGGGVCALRGAPQEHESQRQRQ